MAAISKIFKVFMWPKVKHWRASNFVIPWVGCVGRKRGWKMGLSTHDCALFWHIVNNTKLRVSDWGIQTQGFSSVNYASLWGSNMISLLCLSLQFEVWVSFSHAHNRLRSSKAARGEELVLASLEIYLVSYWHLLLSQRKF